MTRCRLTKVTIQKESNVENKELEETQIVNRCVRFLIDLYPVTLQWIRAGKKINWSFLRCAMYRAFFVAHVLRARQAKGRKDKTKKGTMKT